MHYSYSNYAPHYRALLSLGIPLVVGQIGTIILGFADTLMIGHHSSMELAAAGFVTNIFNLALITAIGFSYGLTPVVGNLFGQEKHERIGGMLKNGLASNAVVALLLVVIMGTLYLNLDKMGQPEELLPVMRPYFLVNLVSIPFAVLFNTVKQFFDGTAHTKVPMWTMIVSNLVNILGNYLLIYGKMGFPELGLLGAGISTCVSRMMMGIGLLVWFMCSSNYKVYRKGFFAACVNRADFLKLNRMGWPVAFQIGMETAAFSLSVIMIGWIGALALTAHQIAITISQIFYMIYYGLSSAVAVRVSFFHGQHDFKALRRASYSGCHITLVLIVVNIAFILLTRNVLGGLFTDDAAASALVAQVALPLAVYQLGDGMQYVFANSLRGLSCVKPMMYTAFIAYFVISLPLGYLFGIRMGYGLVGIWYAFPFGLTSAAILYYVWFIKNLHREEATWMKEKTTH